MSWKTSAVLIALVAAPAAGAEEAKRLAVVVGVAEYDSPKLPALRFTENDAEKLADVLVASGYEVRLLTTSRGRADAKDSPTAANIEKAVAAMAAGRDRRDTVLLALSGHGVQMEVADPGRKGASRTFGYFCPSDADLSAPISYSTGRGGKLLHLTDTFAVLGASSAGARLVLVDACRNEMAASSARSADYGVVKVPAGVGALFSCKAGEKSFEVESLRHGLFFHFVLEALRDRAADERGDVTWGRLVAHVTAEVKANAGRLAGGGANQEPRLVAVEVGDAVLVRPTGEGAFLRGYRLNTAGRRDAAGAAREFETAARQGSAVAKGELALLLHSGHGEVAKDAERAKTLAAEALPPLTALAERGRAEACNTLGKMHQRGVGVDKDEAKAVALFRRAADRGHAGAMSNLAKCYADGRGVGRDPSAAAGWMRRAADLGVVGARASLGRYYSTGIGVDRDFKESAKLLRAAAESGNARAMYRLGLLYEAGNGVEKDEAAARRWYRTSAEAGDVFGMRAYAVLAESGRGGAANLAEAMKWYRASADAGSAQAMGDVGRLFEYGRGTAKDARQAAEWYRRSAEAGDARGMCHYGQLLSRGDGVEKDGAAAAGWYRKSADAGHAHAMTLLGRTMVATDAAGAAGWYRKAAERGDTSGMWELAWALRQGRGVTANASQGVEWFRKGAAAGHVASMRDLGYMVENGVGTDRDEKAAAEWYRRAVDRGDAPAMNNLGLLLRDGRGVAKDEAEAVRLFRLSAERGNRYAMWNLGRCHETGTAVAKDQAEAVAWYRKAAALGHDAAKKALVRLKAG